MMNNKFIEINRIPEGSVKLPPSKSISHRALIMAALSGKGSELINIEPLNDDVKATLACLKAMGLKYSRENGGISIDEGISLSDRNIDENILIDCVESGSTLRFIIPLALALENPTAVTGRSRLMERPMKDYLDALRARGAQITTNEEEILLKGPMRGGIYEFPGNISSQYISGLLMTLPLLKENSEIRLTTELESRPYVEMTIEVMKSFGVSVEKQGSRAYGIPGNQRYRPAQYTIEGDYSAGAYFLVAGALGCNVDCAGLAKDTSQGDKKIIEIIESCGGSVFWKDDGSVQASGGRLGGLTVDIKDCPDLAPPLAVLLSFCEGESSIVGAGRLKMKESDRLRSISEALNGLGANISVGEDRLVITGVTELDGGTVYPHNDHRIAMAGALAFIKSRKPVKVLDPDCVNKSYPNFFNDFCKVSKEVER
jgi:3-phosphoshikimate 1-carboxyvinyltransferase